MNEFVNAVWYDTRLVFLKNKYNINPFNSLVRFSYEETDGRQLENV